MASYETDLAARIPAAVARRRSGPLLVLVFSLCASLASATAAARRPAEPPFMAQLVAKSFFRGLLEGNRDALLPLCATEVNFDGLPLRGGNAIGRKLDQLIARARQRKLKLRRVLLLDLPTMKRRYGPPPERIRRSVPRGAMIALARFDHLGAVAVLGRRGGFWRVVALTD